MNWTWISFFFKGCCLIVYMLFSISCGSLSTVPQEKGATLKEKYAQEENQLNSFESLLTAKQYSALNDALYDYFKTTPQPQHWYAFMFYYGLAKEGLEDWSGALFIYQQIVDRSFNREMEFVALAFYRRAYCYEVLFENEKALASLTDAGRLKVYLPMEITLAEIPARMASLHARLRQTTVADAFTRRAERGIQRLRALRKREDTEWIGKSLVKMGSVSLAQVDEESFRQNVMTLMRNQRYLIQAIELKHPVWSVEAQKTLLSVYGHLWSFILNYRVSTSVDWELDRLSESNKKTEFIALYLESLEKLKNFEAPGESSAFLQTVSLYKQIKIIESQALSLLTEEMLKKPWDEPLKYPDRLPSSVRDVDGAFESDESSVSQSVRRQKTENHEDLKTPKKLDREEFILDGNDELELKDQFIRRPLPKKKVR